VKSQVSAGLAKLRALVGDELLLPPSRKRWSGHDRAHRVAEVPAGTAGGVRRLQAAGPGRHRPRQQAADPAPPGGHGARERGCRSHRGRHRGRPVRAAEPPIGRDRRPGADRRRLLGGRLDDPQRRRHHRDGPRRAGPRRTSVGFVTLDGANNVYSVTGRGVRRIGQAAPAVADGIEKTRLYSDPHGTLAGWLGGDGSGLVLQVHDQATGQTRSFGTAGASPPNGILFFAIDDRTVYRRFGTEDGVFAVDFDTGAERQLAGGVQARNLVIWSVENGVLAFSSDYPSRGNVTSLRVGRSIDDAREFTFGTNAEADNKLRLSPTGAWVSYLLYQFDGPPIQDKVLAFTGQVRDTRTGELVGLKLPNAGFALPVVWLDDTTVQILAFGEKQGYLYACSVPDGSCSVGATLPASALDGSNLVLPNGSWVGD
jgi:hypothetical protein